MPFKEEDMIATLSTMTKLGKAEYAKLAAVLNVTFDTIANKFDKKYKKSGQVLLQEAKDAGRLDDNGDAIEDALPKPTRTRGGQAKAETKDDNADDVLHGVASGRVAKAPKAKASKAKPTK